MVLVKTPIDFVERSIQLLQAHPNTTRITTTYHISPPPSTPSTRPKPTKSSSSSGTAQPPQDEKDKDKPKLPRGKLTLKTYDPISGSIIKFRTDRISDVGRIVTGLHRLARSMAGLKDLGTSEAAVEQTAGGPSVTKDAVAGAVAATEGEASAAGGSGSKGGKKKNKKKK